MLLTANFGTTNTGQTCRYQVLDSDKSVFIAQTATGVTELVAGSGLYGVSLDDATVSGKTIVWNIGNKVAAEYISPAYSESEVAAPTVAEIDAYLSGIHGTGSWETGSATNIGTGTILVGIRCLDYATGHTLDGVGVWVSTDLAQSNIVAGKVYSDAFGIAEVMLDSGTYYIWRQLKGYNFANPEIVTI